MNTKSSRSAFSEPLSIKKSNSEKAQLYPVNELLPRPAWFKGSRDRGLKGDIAA